MKTINLVVLTFFMSVGIAHSANISSLFSTGAGASFNDGTVDSNWTVTGGSLPSTTYAVTTPTGLVWGGFTTANAHTNNGVSTWISPSAPPAFHPGGNYTYRTSFDLTGFNLNTVSISGRWEADNRLTSIILNAGTANSQTITLTSQGALLNSVLTQYDWNLNGTSNFDFSLFTNFYKSGVNTLDFVVVNTPNPGNSATGLRVEFTNKSATLAAAIPEPNALVLIGVAAIGIAVTRRQKLA